MCPMLCNSQDPAVEWRWLTKCCWDGLRGEEGFDTQARTSTGEGDNYPNLKVTILHQIPWEAVASAGRCKAGYPQEAAAFPCKCSAPLVGFFRCWCFDQRKHLGCSPVGARGFLCTPQRASRASRGLH